METGIVPYIDTGAVHETDPDAGQIGAGAARAPIGVFQEALVALGEAWDRQAAVEGSDFQRRTTEGAR